MYLYNDIHKIKNYQYLFFGIMYEKLKLTFFFKLIIKKVNI